MNSVALRWIGVACFCCAGINQDGRAFQYTQRMDDADFYQCEKLVQVVNSLRSLGKEKSLSALRAYLKNGGDHTKVIVICRLLFDNPKPWAIPKLGQPVPPVHQKIARELPLFPVVLSNRVPFVIVDMYELAGARELAWGSLENCEKLDLVKETYPLDGYETAARALIQTRTFQLLFQEADRQWVADWMMFRAMRAKKRD